MNNEKPIKTDLKEVKENLETNIFNGEFSIGMMKIQLSKVKELLEE